MLRATFLAMASAFRLIFSRSRSRPDDLQLGPMGVVRERLHDVRAGVHELAVQRLHEVGPLQHDLGHVGARLEESPALELEEIAFRTDDGSPRQPLEQPGGLPFRLLRLRGLGWRHDWIASSLPKM